MEECVGTFKFPCIRWPGWEESVRPGLEAECGTVLSASASAHYEGGREHEFNCKFKGRDMGGTERGVLGVFSPSLSTTAV